MADNHPEYSKFQKLSMTVTVSILFGNPGVSVKHLDFLFLPTMPGKYSKEFLPGIFPG